MKRISGLALCAFAVAAAVIGLLATGTGATRGQTAGKRGGERKRGEERKAAASTLGTRLERTGDEIMVCGQLYHTTAKVVLWTDPGGYDAYRVERRFAPLPESAWGKGNTPGLKRPNRYAARRRGLSAAELEQTRGGGWDLETLRKVVDQFVIHFDARGSSKKCFEILHDIRGLSVHFMIDIDGVIYQTLDLKEAAQHATIANSRSIGVEVANIGAYPIGEPDPFAKYYSKDKNGRARLIDQDALIPESGRVLHPAGGDIVKGEVQGKMLRQYDFTPEQYNALTRLAATLCKIFPKIKPDYPRNGSTLINHKLDAAEYAAFEGILGHYHVQLNKVDPGPAFQWERFIQSTRTLLKQ